MRWFRELAIMEPSYEFMTENMAKVLIYTTPTCSYCKMTKEFFKEHNVEYTEKDVAGDEKAADEMVKKTGQMAVPVIIVEHDGGKEDMIVGFDKEKLSTILGL